MRDAHVPLRRHSGWVDAAEAARVNLGLLGFRVVRASPAQGAGMRGAAVNGVLHQHPPQEEWVLAAVVVYTPPACRRFLGAVAPRTHFTPPSAAGAGVPSHSYTFRVPKFTHWPRSGLVFCFRLGARRHILARGGALAHKYPLSVRSLGLR